MSPELFADKLRSCSRPNDTLRPMDGQVAAVLPSEPSFGLPCLSFITTPNQPIIPHPPLGLRSVICRVDSLYGDDDYCQWPQPFSHLHPHLACIPCSASSAQDECMWYRPTRADFVVASPVDHPDTGRLHSIRLTAIVTASTPVFTRAKAYQDAHPHKTSVITLISQLVQVLRHCLTRLTFVPTSFEEVTSWVRVVQRYWKEIVALLDYMEIFKPQMDDPQESFKSRAVANTIGAFVWDCDDAIHLFHARIPFWFIQYQHALLDHNVLAVVPLTLPDTILEMQVMAHPPVFKGQAGSVEHLDALRLEGAKRMKSLNPFRLSSANKTQGSSSGRDQHHLNPSSSSSRSRSASPDQRSLHDKSQKDPRLQINPDTFNPLPHHDYLPDRLPTWEQALKNVNLSEKNLVSRSMRTQDDNKTIFPQPQLFFGTTDRAKRCLVTWRAIREACKFRIISSKSNPLALSKQEWCDLLYAVGNARTAKLLEIFKEPFDECQIDYASLNLIPLTSLSDIPISTFRQIFWELFELNFRWDLKLLDERARCRDAHSILHEEHLQNALATSGLFAFDFVHSSSGLASLSPQLRLPALLGLRKLVQDWDGRREPILDQSQDNYATDSEIQVLETALAKYICQSFFNYFGRPISIPFRLSQS
ncbi:hypothetical protein BDN72DRAFT_905464 [Pluteus cervinus]|uniref:Uncharacterized protein n=1 Tax=Pluteus cervinus TaxID=181527 RepID=A0ACD3A2D3_9AGAR|nr:hypothetical protein BDN72DRAFT_905464 [Pluteus cervinus]